MKTVGILSFKNRSMALIPACRRLELHFVRFALALALASDGRRSAARIAIIAITTSNSTSVKPPEELLFQRPVIRLIVGSIWHPRQAVRIDVQDCRARARVACLYDG